MSIRTAVYPPPAVASADVADTSAMHERERRHAVGPSAIDAAIQVDSPARLPPEKGTGMAAGEWHDLFNTVNDRLFHIACAGTPAGHMEPEPGATGYRERLLECVSTLRLLQATVNAERMRTEWLETALCEAQAALTQVRARLVGTQLQERRARHDAMHDHLTLLPNRGFLLERIGRQLASAAARQRMFAVMFLDLDGFKRVNDTHGHGVGDKLLRIVAARLRGIVRARDVVSRVGGDEFACLIGSLHDRGQLAQLADKMAQCISAPCSVAGIQLVVHASIGIATSPIDGQSADALLANADLAMYAAKRQQTRHAFFRCEGAATAAVANVNAVRSCTSAATKP